METILRVYYPRLAARITLRTDANWGQTIAPVQVVGDCATFRITTEAPFFYFKPCLRRLDGVEVFSVGTDYLGIAESERSLYPHFSGGLSGSISGVLTAPVGAPDAHRIRVYLPPGYNENTLKRYPVLYMQDGSNLFFPDEAFAGVPWDVAGTLETLDRMSLIDRVIVVGIQPKNRAAEYTEPGVATYTRYLVEGLKPAIDASLRTLQGPASTAILGSSLGGVAALLVAWAAPETFGLVGCLSSTFGYQDALYERISAERKPLKIYLDSGWPRDNYEATRAMADKLVSVGYGRDLLYLCFPGASHSEAAWQARLHIPMQFFFGKSLAFQFV